MPDFSANLAFLALRRGRGVSSMTSSGYRRRFLEKFPRTGSSASDPCILSEAALSMNCLTVGLSHRPPLAR